MLPKKKLSKFKFFFLTFIFTAAFLLMVFSSRADSQTTDEAVHLFSGYTYLTQKDFRLDPEHPPLLKELGALPLLFIKPKYELGNLWKKADEYDYDSWREARVLGENFFYLSNNNPEKLLFWGRLPFILLTLLLGYWGYCWAKKMYGQKAGVLAAFLILFFPNILAHGRLINTDLGLALFIFLTVYLWGNFLKKPNFLNLFFVGLSLGLTLTSKFTGLIIIPILLLLFFIKALLFDQKKMLLGKYFIGFIGVLLIAFVVVWASYGFLLEAPAEFSKGLMLVFGHAFGGHDSFLLGQNSNVGWWYYFPVVIFYKTPIPIFFFLAISILFWKKLRSKELFDEILLILPPFVYLLASMFSRADLGIRHILPIFPFLFVLAARSINLVDFSKVRISNLVFLGLVLWYLVGTLVNFPNYLAYFNEFAGGPKGGYKILTDSNLDWGQDIFRLKKYLDENKIEKVYLVYPWNGNLALKYYGLNFEPLYPENRDVKGPVVISATYFQSDAYAWLHQYRFSQITPGLFYINIPLR